MSYLEHQVKGRPKRIVTPFGVVLTACNGKYAIGQTVSAPSIDDCSPRMDALVLTVGTRGDYGGNWYLVCFGNKELEFVLVDEEGLRPSRHLPS